MYKLYKDNFNGYECVVRLVDNAHIPMDESNRDYQNYLKWVAEGNTPEPAEG